MCGIVGYIGQEPAVDVLLEGLHRLEYRGYDSAGVAVWSPGRGMQVVKAQGRLQMLKDLLARGAPLQGTTGVGHTRWATHGRPSDVNSHPHTGEAGRIAVVHNGIIENYMKLKEFLEGKGVRFQSETDTEVVAQLLEYYYDGNILEAVGRVLRRIEGSYALGILCSDCPEQLIAARKDSPLVLGWGDGCKFLASDVTAVVNHTRRVSYLEEGEIAVLTQDHIAVYTADLEPVAKEIVTVDWEISAAEKGGHAHFMFKEILEQPRAVKDALFPRIREGRVVLDGLALTPGEIRAIRKICVIACGSSYHVGMVAKYTLEKLVRKPVEVTLASEFRYCDPLVDGGTLVVAISQSGETADTLAALREAKRRGCPTLAVVNVVGSSISKEAEHVLYTWAGPEIAVATTKGYSTQLAVMDLLALFLGDACGTLPKAEYDAIVAALLALPGKMEQILKNEADIQYYASLYFNHSSVFFLGRNVDYAVGLEGSLKLKEISYIHSEAYAAGELKHGTISLIEDGTLVVALCGHVALFDKLLSNVKEVLARGAEVVAVGPQSRCEQLKQLVHHVICVPDTHPVVMPSLAVLPLQLFAYYVALLRGCDVDQPRNLAKSVTVE